MKYPIFLSYPVDIVAHIAAGFFPAILLIGSNRIRGIFALLLRPYSVEVTDNSSGICLSQLFQLAVGAEKIIGIRWTTDKSMFNDHPRQILLHALCHNSIIISSGSVWINASVTA